LAPFVLIYTDALVGCGIGIIGFICMMVFQELMPGKKRELAISIDMAGSYYLMTVGYTRSGAPRRPMAERVSSQNDHVTCILSGGAVDTEQNVWRWAGILQSTDACSVVDFTPSSRVSGQSSPDTTTPRQPLP
jgi:hypothetical protein